MTSPAYSPNYLQQPQSVQDPSVPMQNEYTTTTAVNHLQTAGFYNPPSQPIYDQPPPAQTNFLPMYSTSPYYMGLPPYFAAPQYIVPTVMRAAHSQPHHVTYPQQQQPYFFCAPNVAQSAYSTPPQQGHYKTGGNASHYDYKNGGNFYNEHRPYGNRVSTRYAVKFSTKNDKNDAIEKVSAILQSHDDSTIADGVKSAYSKESADSTTEDKLQCNGEDTPDSLSPHINGKDETLKVQHEIDSVNNEEVIAAVAEPLVRCKVENLDAAPCLNGGVTEKHDEQPTKLLLNDGVKLPTTNGLNFSVNKSTKLLYSESVSKKNFASPPITQNQVQKTSPKNNPSVNNTSVSQSLPENRHSKSTVSKQVENSTKLPNGLGNDVTRPKKRQDYGRQRPVRKFFDGESSKSFKNTNFDKNHGFDKNSSPGCHSSTVKKCDDFAREADANSNGSLANSTANKLGDKNGPEDTIPARQHAGTKRGVQNCENSLGKCPGNNAQDSEIFVTAEKGPETERQNSTVSCAAGAGKSWASLFNAKGDKLVQNSFIGDLPDNTKSAENCKNHKAATVTGNKTVENIKVEKTSVSYMPQHQATFAEISAKNAKFLKISSCPTNAFNAQAIDNDEDAQKLGAHLQTYQLFHRGQPYQLRGLTNFGSWCYVNTTLQALMACPPFVHLMRDLRKFLPRRACSATPVLDLLVDFVAEFSDKIIRRGPQDLDIGPPFEPTQICNALISCSKLSSSFKGKQEDAEEFLSLLLNAMHDEVTKCIEFAASSTVESHSLNGSDLNENNEDEWHQVGVSKKAVVTRTTKMVSSPIVKIFSGCLRNTIQANGKTSANLESFFVLPLDIQPDEVTSINTALQHMHRELIKTTMKGKGEVNISKRTTFQELPAVFVMQLKYFLCDQEGHAKKLKKFVEFGVDLAVDRSMLTLINAGKSDRFSRSYKLFAVVYHHGPNVTCGHYTVSTFHGGFWVHLDDAKITPVDENQVLLLTPPSDDAHWSADRVPYLLFYRRCDNFVERRNNYGSYSNPTSGGVQSSSSYSNPSAGYSNPHVAHNNSNTAADQ